MIQIKENDKFIILIGIMLLILIIFLYVVMTKKPIDKENDDILDSFKVGGKLTCGGGK